MDRPTLRPFSFLCHVVTLPTGLLPKTELILKFQLLVKYSCLHSTQIEVLHYSNRKQMNTMSTTFLLFFLLCYTFH